MVVLFCDRKDCLGNEISDILTSFGADYISDGIIISKKSYFTVINEYRKIKLKTKRCVALFVSSSRRFSEQILPIGTIGICEDSNSAALSLFQKNGIPVISCGLGSKNTVTLSSLNETLLVSIQRTLTDLDGKKILPAEYPIHLTRHFSPFAVMASTVALLLHGFTPDKF